MSCCAFGIYVLTKNVETMSHNSHLGHLGKSHMGNEKRSASARSGAWRAHTLGSGVLLKPFYHIILRSYKTPQRTSILQRDLQRQTQCIHARHSRASRVRLDTRTRETRRMGSRSTSILQLNTHSTRRQRLLQRLPDASQSMY